MENETLALTHENVETVLDELRPFLMADGGNVEIVEIDGPISFDGFISIAGTGGSDNGNHVIKFNCHGSNLEGWVSTVDGVSSITSDYRIKENVTPIQDGVLDKINQLNPINYTQGLQK